jgi:hypothetical protein
MVGFPINAERFIHLQVLACLHATSTQDALIRIVAVEGIGHVHFVWLGLVRDFLMFDLK